MRRELGGRTDINREMNKEQGRGTGEPGDRRTKSKKNINGEQDETYHCATKEKTSSM